MGSADQADAVAPTPGQSKLALSLCSASEGGDLYQGTVLVDSGGAIGADESSACKRIKDSEGITSSGMQGLSPYMANTIIGIFALSREHALH